MAKSKIDLLLKISLTVTLLLLLAFVWLEYLTEAEPYEYSNNLDYKPRMEDRVDLDKDYFDFGDVFWDYCNSSQGSSMHPCYIHVFEKSDDIQAGDIVFIKMPGESETEPLKHRVVEIGEDKEGIYYITKGDRNKDIDETKWRREDIMYVVVAEFK